MELCLIKGICRSGSVELHVEWFQMAPYLIIQATGWIFWLPGLQTHFETGVLKMHVSLVTWREQRCFVALR